VWSTCAVLCGQILLTSFAVRTQLVSNMPRRRCHCRRIDHHHFITVTLAPSLFYATLETAVSQIFSTDDQLKPQLTPLTAFSHNIADQAIFSFCSFLWPPCAADADIIFLPGCFCYLLLSFFPSPNLSVRRVAVHHTSTHGVALVRV